MASKFEVTILGCNSSQPTLDRMLTSQVVDIDGSCYLIDCGEGTQIQMTKYRVKRNNIRAVFISHFHGDHLYGLPGFITSFLHFSRIKPLLVFGPVGIKKYLDTIFEISQVHLDFELNVIETDVDKSSMIYSDDKVEVHNFTLSHRIPTQGFIFKEKISEFQIKSDSIAKYQLTFEDIRTLKSGKNISKGDGINITVVDTCYPINTPRSYAFMSDTSPLNEIPACLEEVEVLYHETTYLNDLSYLSEERGHSTTIQAAEFAKRVQCKKLIVGHYSSRYGDIKVFEEECRSVFTNTAAAFDGMKVTVSKI